MLQGTIHYSLQPVRRAAGQSVIARLAYQMGDVVHDQRTDVRHDFSYKHPEIGDSCLFLRQKHIADPVVCHTFWNSVELHHTRKDAVPARTASIALPLELSPKQNTEAMRCYASWVSTTYGVAVQATAHKLDSGNPHFHLVISACSTTTDGTLGKKVAALDPISCQRNHIPAPAETLRQRWAEIVNSFLKDAKSTASVDHRSYKRRGISRIPQTHEGAARHIQQRHPSISTKATVNKTIHEVNILHEEIAIEKAALDAQLAELRRLKTEEARKPILARLADKMSGWMKGLLQHSNAQQPHKNAVEVLENYSDDTEISHDDTAVPHEKISVSPPTKNLNTTHDILFYQNTHGNRILKKRKKDVMDTTLVKTDNADMSFWHMPTVQQHEDEAAVQTDAEKESTQSLPTREENFEFNTKHTDAESSESINPSEDRKRRQTIRPR